MRLKDKSDSYRKKLMKLRDKAHKEREDFEEDFEKLSEKYGDLLASVPDLLAIFDGCFPSPRQSNGGVIREGALDPSARSQDDKGKYAFRFPKGYRPDARSWPLIISVPPKEKGGWMRGKDYLEASWPKDAEEVAGEFVHVAPDFPAGLELGATVDQLKGDEKETQRRSRLLQTLAQVFEEFRIDTDRVFIEACGDSTPFALRLASLFPDRFAGLVLKNPTSTANCTPQNLGGVAVLVIHDAAHKDKAEALKKMLPACDLIAADGEVPFGAKAGEIGQWLAKQKRDLFPAKVTLAPAHELYRKAYWVDISAMEELGKASLEDRPMVEVTADRATNKITIKSKKVSDVRLFLNDAIVDLDKEIAIDRNGQVMQVKLARNKRLLWDPREGLVFRRGDPRYLFVAVAVVPVPAPEGEAKEADSPKDGGTGEK
ncbi:MAG: hypothetical protein R3F30_10745 [Planctomycetota bacterium]